ncbi:MAG: FeoB-associated Cys-rich membrane protein [Treponema sp.]
MSIQNIIAGIIIAAAVLFLARRYYKIFTGKKSGCSCGTKHFIVKNGTVTEERCSCGCSGCCNTPKGEKS